MTEDALRSRVMKWQHRLKYMGVGHFEIDVKIVDKIESEKEGVRAQVSVSPYYDAAEIEFTPQSVEAPDIDYVIVHELLHVAFRDHDDAVASAVSFHGREAREAHQDRIDHEVEGLVDRLARTIIEFYHDDQPELVH